VRGAKISVDGWGSQSWLQPAFQPALRGGCAASQSRLKSRQNCLPNPAQYNRLQCGRTVATKESIVHFPQPLARARGSNFLILLFGLLILTGCKPETPLEPAIGEAFAGPAACRSAKTCPAIAPSSPPSITGAPGNSAAPPAPGQVRTARKIEGWTDERLLLTPDQVAGLRKMNEAG